MKKVELHVHTEYSYDSNSKLRDIIAKCKNENIDVLGVTDHNEIKGALILANIAPFKVVVGEEILTKDGEIIGLFLKKYIKPGMSITATINNIKKQGGIVYLPHPYDRTTRKTATSEKVIEEVISQVDIIETFNGRTILNSDNIKAEALANKSGIQQSVGSDAHTVQELGRNYMNLENFEGAKEFLSSMKQAERKTSKLLYWPFLVTKWVRKRKSLVKKKKNISSRKLRSGVSCDMCGSKRINVIYEKRGVENNNYYISDNSYGVHGRIVECSTCNLRFVNPTKSSTLVLGKYKRFKDLQYESERSGRQDNQTRILKRLNMLNKNKGKLLDIGCATGSFMELAQNDGWKAWGVDPSRWATSIAKKRHLNAKEGTVKSAKFNKDYFDVIVCIDVIEHVLQPKKLLEETKRILKKGGTLCIVTPDSGSVIPRLLKEKWWHIRPDHIFYFSKQTILNLLTIVGFKVTNTHPAGWTFSYIYWASRFKNNIKIVYDVLLLLKSIPLLNKLTKKDYHLNFRDSLEIYVTK